MAARDVWLARTDTDPRWFGLVHNRHRDDLRRHPGERVRRAKLVGRPKVDDRGRRPRIQVRHPVTRERLVRPVEHARPDRAATVDDQAADIADVGHAV
jgi:hypothetical protein